MTKAVEEIARALCRQHCRRSWGDHPNWPCEKQCGAIPEAMGALYEPAARAILSTGVVREMVEAFKAVEQCDASADGALWDKDGGVYEHAPYQSQELKKALTQARAVLEKVK